jgi:hypothetical protein
MNNKILLTKKLIVSCIIYIILNFFAFLILPSSPLTSILISSLLGFCILYYIWIWFYKFNGAINNFGSYLLLSSIAYRIFNILVLLVVEDPLDSWPNEINTSLDLNIIIKSTSLFTGESLSVFGTLIISLTWFYLGGIKFSRINFVKKESFLSTWILYILASLIFFIKISELALFIYISSFIIIYTVIQINKLNNILIKEHNLIRAFFMLSPFIAISIKTGMKESIIVFLIPILIDLFYRYKTIAARLLLIFCSFISFLFFTLIADFIRLNYWGTKQILSISSVYNYLISTIKTINFEFGFALVSKALLRISPLFYQGWTVSLTYLKDIHYTSLFSNILAMFIPRFLWPTKPLNNPEHEMTVIFYGDKIAETTNEASGLYSELYLKEGFIGFVLISFLLGLYIFLLQKIVFKIKNKLAFNVFNFMLIYFSFRLHEYYFNAIFPGFLLYLIIVIIITGLVNLFILILHSKPIFYSN